MEFIKITPHQDLSDLIECYWMMYSDDSCPVIEKIIPDGFPELIYNYRDLYRSNISGDWNLQTPNLLAGQIKTYFYLENTGATGSIAIKLKPTALTQLFGFNMSQYLDKIVDLNTFGNKELKQLKEQIKQLVVNGNNRQEHIVRNVLDDYFINLSDTALENPLKTPLELIFNLNGMVTVAEIVAITGIGERQIERLFKKYIGLPPKYYARIIRFNYIFKLIKLKENSWTEIVYKSGYFDQSHFIRDFKAFTGEDPSSYYFEKKNMANFFLNK